MRITINILICILICLSIFSCSKKENFESVHVIGHAGMGLENVNALYAENSQESIDLALSIDGCAGVEIDLQLSKDGELWLYHDPFLDDITQATGCISDQLNQTLSFVRYSTFHKEKLIRLKDLKLPTQPQKKFYFLDLKHVNSCDNTQVDALQVELELLTFYNRVGSNAKIFLISTNKNWIHQMDSSKHQMILEVEEIASFWSALSTFHFNGVIMRNKKISSQDVSELKNASKKVLIFEVRAPKPIREALRKKPDFLITDDIRSTLIEKYR